MVSVYDRFPGGSRLARNFSQYRSAQKCKTSPGEPLQVIHQICQRLNSCKRRRFAWYIIISSTRSLQAAGHGRNTDARRDRELSRKSGLEKERSIQHFVIAGLLKRGAVRYLSRDQNDPVAIQKLSASDDLEIKASHLQIQLSASAPTIVRNIPSRTRNACPSRSTGRTKGFPSRGRPPNAV